MRFFVPTDIYIENDCVKNHTQDFQAIGKRALIMTGRHSAAANGSLDDVTGALDAEHIPFQIFNEVEENPSTDTVRKAAQAARDFEADFVIGIGGGSAIDAAKAAALLLSNPSVDADDLHKAPNRPLSHAPVVAVPTTCGTGSEATPVAIITNHKIHLKKSIPHRIFPALALVDGKYLASAKKALVVNTAVDALSHMVESILNVKSNAFNRMFPEYGLRLWGECKSALLSDKDIDANLYEKLMLTSTIAGMSIAHTSTTLPHGMSYDLTLNAGVPHGPAVGYFLAAYTEVCAKFVPGDVEKILSLLGLKNIDDFTAMLQNLIGTYAVTREMRDKFAAAMKVNRSKLDLAPGPISPEDVDFIYEKSLNIKP
ncbi:MAG: iron-containing alcohol dehydrogenase [Fibrobacter sp.]|uniref:iron-containing alcohol dehydrogenase family protein n=1 Tax=Fibrobacter sp. TaxID=35828 RepID=UPI0025C47B97|nr:iron-containing alcohol dehydrogenase family protein [Fibrobacter sp.]MBR4786120.1 iron-containing alcohol dehydrogenase [Fibrobacter sp.]